MGFYDEWSAAMGELAPERLLEDAQQVIDYLHELWSSLEASGVGPEEGMASAEGVATLMGLGGVLEGLAEVGSQVGELAIGAYIGFAGGCAIRVAADEAWQALEAPGTDNTVVACVAQTCQQQDIPTPDDLSYTPVSFPPAPDAILQDMGANLEPPPTPVPTLPPTGPPTPPPTLPPTPPPTQPPTPPPTQPPTPPPTERPTPTPTPTNGPTPPPTPTPTPSPQPTPTPSPLPTPPPPTPTPTPSPSPTPTPTPTPTPQGSPAP